MVKSKKKKPTELTRRLITSTTGASERCRFEVCNLMEKLFLILLVCVHTPRVGRKIFFVIILEALKLHSPFKWDFNLPHSQSYLNHAIVRVVLHCHQKDAMFE